MRPMEKKAFEEFRKLIVLCEAFTVHVFDPFCVENNNQGKFLSSTGEVFDAPPPDKNFVIMAGLWENVKGRHGAMQGKCASCEELVGLGPASQAILRENPECEILCIPCANLVAAVVKYGEKT